MVASGDAVGVELMGGSCLYASYAHSHCWHLVGVCGVSSSCCRTFLMLCLHWLHVACAAAVPVVVCPPQLFQAHVCESDSRVQCLQSSFCWQ